MKLRTVLMALFCAGLLSVAPAFAVGEDVSSEELALSPGASNNLTLTEQEVSSGSLGEVEIGGSILDFEITEEGGEGEGEVGGDLIEEENPGEVTDTDESGGGPVDVTSSRVFYFKLFLFDKNGDALTGSYDAQITRGDGAVENVSVRHGDVIELGDEDSIDIFDLPEKTQYQVEEVDEEGFVSRGHGTSGSIVGDQISNVSFVNTEKGADGPVLPSSGGLGVQGYLSIGGALIALGAVLARQRQKRGDGVW